jgi:hypothetical protein
MVTIAEPETTGCAVVVAVTFAVPFAGTDNGVVWLPVWSIVPAEAAHLTGKYGPPTIAVNGWTVGRFQPALLLLMGRR